MRLGVIADIHGNLVALEAVLADAHARGVDSFVCLGDVASTGPQPQQVVRRLRDLGCPIVMGNADAWLLDLKGLEGEDETSRKIEEIGRWCADQLSEDDRALLRRYQPTVALELEGVTVLAVHGSPRSFDEETLATTSGETLDGYLQGVEAQVELSGHTHLQMVRRHRTYQLVNPGSVGMPFDQAPAAYASRNPAWAEYGVLEVRGGRLGIELSRVPLSVEAVRSAGLASGMPYAAWWAGDWADV